ncbi:MAG: esterase-like activity of phytase family protein [Sphingomicrobium sp.]
MGLVGALLIVAVLALVTIDHAESPDRYMLGSRTVPLHAVPLRVDSAGVLPLRFVAGWRLTAPDPRFGGLSALAIDHGKLLAVSDSAVLFRFAPPSGGPAMVAISDIADGPRSPSLKADRDSESLARDAFGRGWWVGFETRNQLWLYSPDFRRALGKIDFTVKRWPQNLGIEAMLADRDGLILVPELAHEVVKVAAGKARSEPLAGVGFNISDMVQLPDGETIVLMRDLRLTGFDIALGALVHTPTGWRVERRVPLKLGVFMNVEGVTAQRLPGGATRLWLVTDDNFRTPMTTALFALDIPSGRWAGRASR